MAVMKSNSIEDWIPKTELGRRVKSGEIKDISEILDSGSKILEPEIVDKLLPDLTVELIEVGQRASGNRHRKKPQRETQSSSQHLQQ